MRVPRTVFRSNDEAAPAVLEHPGARPIGMEVPMSKTNATRGSLATGIDVRHRKTCPGYRADGKCCKPTYQANAYDKHTGKLIRRTFPTKTAAKQWRQDAIV